MSDVHRARTLHGRERESGLFGLAIGNVEKSGTKRILYVDDETSILKCYQATLSAKGYESLVTDDPAEALEISE